MWLVLPCRVSIIFPKKQGKYEAKKNWESQGGSLSERQTLCYGTQQILGLPGIFPHDFPSFSFAFVQLEDPRLHLAAYPWLSILVAPFAFRFSRFHSALLLTFLLGNCGWKGYFSSRGIFSAECM